MRRAARVDGNQSQLAAAFRSLGCSVLSLAPLGGGVPDLLVAINGITWLVEVKMPKGKENEMQVEFAITWKGCRAVVRDLQGVELTVKTMKFMA